MKLLAGLALAGGLLAALASPAAADCRTASGNKACLSPAGGGNGTMNPRAIANSDLTGITTLGALVSIQGFTATLSDPGVDAFWGWDDSANAWEALTAAEGLAIIKTVDGSGSGLDADTIDGIDSTALVQTSRTLTGGTGIAAIGDLSADRTITLDLTELSTATFGAGAFTTLTFDAGATDPVFTFGSNSWSVTGASSISFGTGSTVTMGSIELGNASDTTIQRNAAGSISIEGISVARNSPSLTHTALQYEIGDTSDTTLARVSAGVASIEGVTILTTATGQGLDADLTAFAGNAYAANASQASYVDFWEDTDNGANRVRLSGAQSTADVTVTLPAATTTLMGQDTADAMTNKSSVVFGDTAQRTLGAGVAGAHEQFGTDAASGTMVLGMFNATAGTGADLQLYRSKNAAVNTATVVASGDNLGSLTWYGAQQTSTLATVSAAARVRAEVDGTVTSGASGDMPGRLVFSTTADGSATLTDRLILDSAGILKPNANDGVALGTGSLSFSDLFLASGGVINFNNGNATLTHSAGLITSNVPFSVGTSNAITAGSVEVGAATDTTLSRASAGDVAVEGNRIFRVGGADVPVADGGTGLSSGTSGGVLYYSAAGTLASSGALAAGSIVVGGGAGAAPSTITLGGDCTLSGSTITCKPTEAFCVAISDETTAITTGTAKVTFRMPYAFTLTEARASLNTVSSSGAPAFDINEGGVSIFSTTLTIDASEKTSTTAATAAVISDSSLADDAEMTIDIDTAGTGAKGAKICLIGKRT